MDFMSLFALPLYFVSTILTINFVWKCWKKEVSLPQACHYENLTFLISQSENKIESLNKDHEALKIVVKEKSILEFQIPILKEQLENLQREIDTRSDAEIHAKGMIQDYEGKILSLSLEESALNKKINSLNKSLSTIETALKEKNFLDIEVASQQQQLLSCQQQLQQYQNELLSLSAEREKQELIKSKIEDLESTLAILREEHSKQNDERKVVEQKVDELKRIADNYKEASLALETKIIKQQTSLAELEEIIKNRQAQIDGMNSENSEIEDSVIKVLARPYIPTRSKRPATDETEALKNLEHYLQNEGLHFDQRTLYRFHTSLKVTAHCPLVILSGISGTGKTLLAQSYATACGLHFLPMAVQPRWDSPQDLFGYYDFTKKQFAATELSRSLLQMDLYNRNQWLNNNSPPQWINDNLLMVLIDEMNIARVEHYFSELLSKLELRRNCIFTDYSSRRVSEISLGNCILPATEQEVSLFIDYNVLFVGTLNEDETTLALSDKILDRANVIHFGKPDAFSQKKKNSSPIQDKSMLSYETWKGWLKDDSYISISHKSEIDKILDGFNKFMGEIGRPIGHRTYQAIIAYIANYPAEGSEIQWKEALADQVEQKLMTRLRGVDLSTHHNSLSEIESLVKSLGDDKLIKRYSYAKESSYFEWK